MSLNNPAGRLINIINKGKKIDSNAKCKNAWAILFGLEQGDIPNILRKYSLLVPIPSQIRLLIEGRSDIDSSLYLEKISKIEAAFSNVNFSNNWNSFMNHFDETTLYTLRLCDDYLDRVGNTNSVDGKELDEIIEATEVLISKIKKSDLDQNAQDYFLDNLNNIYSVITNYEFLGIKPIEKEIHSSIGGLIVRQNELNKPSNKIFMSEFWRLLRNLALIIDLSINVFQIGGEVYDYLDSPDNSKVIIDEELNLENEIE